MVNANGRSELRAAEPRLTYLSEGPLLTHLLTAALTERDFLLLLLLRIMSAAASRVVSALVF